jgi:hypothetical protein
MNVLKAIIERLNQKLDASNLFPSLYGIAAPDPNNAKSFLAYDGNGQNLLTADYDKTDGTCFWTLRSAVSVRKADAVQVVACQDMYVTTFPLRAYTVIKKTALPCDSNATEGYVMDIFWKYVQGKDTALRSNIGVTDIYFRPVSVSPNTPDLPKQFEYVTLYFDLDVEVTAQLIEGCYDECGVNPIPLPDGSCPPINRVVSVTGLDTDNTDPSRPIVKISVDGTTITGEGTPDNPLVAIGGGGVSVRTQDEGTTIAAVTTTLNFTGAGVTASLASPGNVTVNIPAASGGAVDSVNGETGTVVLDTDDIADTATNRYTNDTDITRLANTSGTNTGDQDLSGLALKTTTISTQSPLTGGGDLSANRTLSIPQANGSTDGFLDSADWVTFNGKFNSPTGTTSEYLRGDGSLATFPPIPSTSGLVPYTGATQDVDLGSNGLTTHDLTVSHPSGSGVAASITKGGSGEALTVVKSSGSGNAASITGGVTLISELHLTTDLADSYIASAATWNAKQAALSAGTGISLASNIVTNTAPDQTVVINAGAGIGVTGTYPNFTIANTLPAPTIYINTNDQTAVTGTTANTRVASQLIPANTVTTGKTIEVKARVGKTGTAGVVTIRVYANTADSISSPAPTLLMTSATTANAQNYNGIDRIAVVKSATQTNTPTTTTSIQNDALIGNAPLVNSNIDWTVDQYIIFAVQNGASGDSSVFSYFKIEIK